MTAPVDARVDARVLDASGESARAVWYTRPGVMLALIGALIVAVAVLTPQDIAGRDGDSRLTTHSTGAQGASLLYELAGRLGWHTERRRDLQLPDTTGGHVVHAILDPGEPPSAVETHALLERVRRGDALLYVLASGGALNDSLHVRQGLGLMYDADDGVGASAARSCPARPTGAAPLWADGIVRLYQLEWRETKIPPLTVFARVHYNRTRGGARSESTLPSAAGYDLGRGRVVLVSDPDLLRNDVLRVCKWGADVVAVRMLEYLRGGIASGRAPDSTSAAPIRRDRLVFDEYHHGYGLHPGTTRAVTTYLSQTASGHLLAALMFAGVIWLLSAAPRLLAPRDAARIERRSPFEHVGALAGAYAQVNATRTATSRLLRGVRRRTERSAAGAGAATDAAFLDWAVAAAPSRAADAKLIRHALDTPVTASELEAVGGALQRLESSLSTLHS